MRRTIALYVPTTFVVGAGWLSLDDSHTLGREALAVALLALAPALAADRLRRALAVVVATLLALAVAFGTRAGDRSRPRRRARLLGRQRALRRDEGAAHGGRRAHGGVRVLACGGARDRRPLAPCRRARHARRHCVAGDARRGRAPHGGWPCWPSCCSCSRPAARGASPPGAGWRLPGRWCSSLRWPAARRPRSRKASCSTGSAGIPTTGPIRRSRVNFVWNANYDGIEFPDKETEVFTVDGVRRSLYWRATTLDTFDGLRWREELRFLGAASGLDAREDPLFPRRGLRPQHVADGRCHHPRAQRTAAGGADHAGPLRRRGSAGRRRSLHRPLPRGRGRGGGGASPRRHVRRAGICAATDAGSARARTGATRRPHASTATWSWCPASSCSRGARPAGACPSSRS